MDRIFGDYIETPPEESEYLHLAFSPSLVPLRQRWRNNGLSADFLAQYLTGFYPHASSPHQTAYREELRETVSHIANELLENAMKYTDEASSYPVHLQLYLMPGDLRLYVTNSVTAAQALALQHFIHKMNNNSPEDFYMEQVEQAAADSSMRTSGLGLLAIREDFQAKLGWRFSAPEPGQQRVTTMAQFLVTP